MCEGDVSPLKVLFFAYTGLTETCCVFLHFFFPVKAGGMRIVQKHPHNSDAKEEKDKDDQDWETSRWAFCFRAYAAANFHHLERYQQVFLADSKQMARMVFIKIVFKQ